MSALEEFFTDLVNPRIVLEEEVRLEQGARCCADDSREEFFPEGGTNSYRPVIIPAEPAPANELRTRGERKMDESSGGADRGSQLGGREFGAEECAGRQVFVQQVHGAPPDIAGEAFLWPCPRLHLRVGGDPFVLEFSGAKNSVARAHHPRGAFPKGADHSVHRSDGRARCSCEISLRQSQAILVGDEERERDGQSCACEGCRGAAAAHNRRAPPRDLHEHTGGTQRCISH